MIKINIQDYIDPQLSVLTGRTHGIMTRGKIDLDKIEEKEEKIEIIIPNNIISFNSSYFIGLFFNSFIKFNSKEEFYKKYSFICDQYIKQDIQDGIEEVLKNYNIL